MFKTKEELLVKAQELNGKTFGQIDTVGFLKNSKNKGKLGHLIEVCHFGYPINSYSVPDFEELGIELKVTPIKKNKNNTFSSKERLVLNIIDYMGEHSIEFEESSFWSKNKELLLIFYLNDETSQPKDWLIVDSILFSYPKDDLKVILDDWKKINEKINNGQAHLISEADTMYLAACTKGSSAEASYRNQPFSNTKAKQRAYSLKQSYMTTLARSFIGDLDEKINSFSLYNNLTFEERLHELLKPYFGKSIDELCKKFNICTDTKVKNLNNILVSRMLGLTCLVQNSSEFKKANIECKTITLSKNGLPKEHMSFNAFRYTDFLTVDYYNSEIYNLFFKHKFLICIFQELNGVTVFRKIKFWNMPLSEVEDFSTIYNRTKEVVLSGNIIKEISELKRYNNFPKSTEHYIGHVRPHGSNTLDTYELPVAENTTKEMAYTKHGFWLNKRYILDIIKDVL